MNEDFFGGMFGKIAPGMCRLSMNGEIAIKTSTGYKSYNVKKNKLVNNSNFCLPIGEDFFFVMPTNKVSVGNIILINGKPRCVRAVEKEAITVINYEDSTVDTVLPERHIFMGNTYFYGKIVSLFGSNMMKGGKGKRSIFKYLMLSEMMKGSGGEGGFGGMNPMMLMMMGNGGLGDMFDGMFDLDEDAPAMELDEDDEVTEEDE